MKKTLVMVLNHNRKAYTDQLVESLRPYVGEEYDLGVMDNGSTDPNEISENTTHKTERNCYYGGALNLAYKLMLDSPEYGSLLFMNNDIILHGHRFITRMREIMDNENYSILSPSVLQPEVTQCYWSQMHNWGSPHTRDVKWVDFMCPLISRHVIEHIKEYDLDLIYGWGQDVYTGLVAEEQGWKIGVTDNIPVIHMSAQTFKDGKSDITNSEYSTKASMGMFKYFEKINRLDDLNAYRTWGNTYIYKDLWIK
jgi:GT2 family glycosyltransferase